MSYALLQVTIDFYTSRKADLENRLLDILTNLGIAVRQTSETTKELYTSQYSGYSLDEYCEAQREIYEDDEDFEFDLDKAERDFELEKEKIREEWRAKFAAELAGITEWETELQLEKQTIEVELAAIKTQLEGLRSMQQKNIDNDHKYGSE